nr:hypothetical protein [Cellulosimicrobium sp. TH-20]
MVDEHGERAAARQHDDVLGAVTTEDEASARVPVVDVGAHRPDLVGPPREQPDVDPAVVVAVDDHDVRVERAPGAGDARVGEPLERDAALRLDDGEDVGTDVGHDARRVGHRELVDPVLDEVDPADPVAPPGRDHLGAGRPGGLRPGAAHEPPAHLAQHRERGGVGAQQAERLQDLGAGVGAVPLLGDQGVDPGVRRQDRVPRGQRARHRARPLEQVLDVERPDPDRRHRGLPRAARDPRWVRGADRLHQEGGPRPVSRTPPRARSRSRSQDRTRRPARPVSPPPAGPPVAGRARRPVTRQRLRGAGADG